VTERLILRPPVADDFEPWAMMCADEELSRHIGGPTPRSLAWRALAGLVGSWHMVGFGPFSAIERETGAWIGCVGPFKPADWPCNEVGWRLAKDARGKGYATEAATAAIDWAFAHLNWPDVAHCISSDNGPSISLALRLGARPLGPLSCPAPYDRLETLAWGQTREEWIARVDV
jgi:RimJ/RimL family protein N-acetyltransferase